MKKQYPQQAQVDALGKILRSMMVDKQCAWDECLYRQSHPTPAQTSYQSTYRVGRSLEYMRVRDEEKQDMLDRGTNAIFKFIKMVEGTAPAVGVLKVQSDGTCAFFYDSDPRAMDITFHTIGLRNGYFSREDIDPPEIVLEKLAKDAKWEKLLDNGSLFELSFVEADYGYPCPDSLRAIEDAVERELTAMDIARVTDIEFEEVDGRSLERLLIGVAAGKPGAEAIGSLMRKIRAPDSTTLRQVRPQPADCAMGLKPKAELITAHMTHLMEELVAESVRCSPPNWQKGTLTIGTDGSWVDYKLKNEASPDRAAISGELRQLCEDFCVIMWRKGDKWTQAILNFMLDNGKVSFNIAFSYDAPAKFASQSEEARPSAVAKPWWKIW